jgi:hypothetical protein
VCSHQGGQPQRQHGPARFPCGLQLFHAARRYPTCKQVVQAGSVCAKTQQFSSCGAMVVKRLTDQVVAVATTAHYHAQLVQAACGSCMGNLRRQGWKVMAPGWETHRPPEDFVVGVH